MWLESLNTPTEQWQRFALISVLFISHVLVASFLSWLPIEVKYYS
jgi:hypothetical protein